MLPTRRILLSLSILLGLGLTAASAQQQRGLKDPHVGYVYPAGGQQGAVFEVTIGGQFLDGVKGVLLSGDGVQAVIEKYVKPFTSKEFNELRDKLMEAWMKSTATDSSTMGKPAMPPQGTPPNPPQINIDALIKNGQLATLAKEIGIDDDKIQALVDYRRKLSDPKRQQNPQLSECVVVKITVAPGATVGMRELRLETPIGISNPLRFYVGNLPEIKKPDADTRAEILAATPIESLPVTLNGQLLPGHTDRYSFTAREGQQLVARAFVRGLIPYLADAVPGWFQAGLTIFDDKGHELAHADDFRYDPDPVLLFEVPADGNYILEIKDTLYRGREDFVYRVTIGELPFITSIFPLGGRQSEKTGIDLSGWNLPRKGTHLDETALATGKQLLTTPLIQGMSTSLYFAVDTLPECFEKEPNNDIATAQRLHLPIIVNGRIDKPGDRDVFCFEGRAGDWIVAEVNARRLNSPVDSMLQLCDANGKQIAANDDFDDKGEGLSTHLADSRILCSLPTNGLYYLTLTDAQHKGGPDFGYRLRVSTAQPDFALRAAPSCLNVRAGALVPLSVYAIRKDGFNGEILLSLKNAPLGASLDGARIPPGQDMVRLTLSVPATTPLGTTLYAIEGNASIRGDQVRHDAVPADDMMQAFSYRHLVASELQRITVLEGTKYNPPIKIAQVGAVKLHAGSTTHVRFNVNGGSNVVDQTTVELNDPPTGIVIEKIEKDKNAIDVSLHADKEKIKDELSGNLIFNLVNERVPQAATGKPAGPRQRSFMGVLPAVPFDLTR
jgi:hypothetical protein